MTEWLTVDNVEMARLPGGRNTAPYVTTHSSGYFGIRVSVTNHSAQETAYVTAAITGIEYEAQSRVLRVKFVAPEAVQYKQARPVLVEHVPLGPHAETVLEARIASPVTYLERVSDTRWTPQVVDVDTDVDRIELMVTYADKPPPSRLNLAAEPADIGATWRRAEGVLSVNRHS